MKIQIVLNTLLTNTTVLKLLSLWVPVASKPCSNTDKFEPEPNDRTNLSKMDLSISTFVSVNLNLFVLDTNTKVS